MIPKDSINQEIPENMTYVTAPSRGYFCLCGLATQAGDVLSLETRNSTFASTTTYSGTGNPYMRIFLPVNYHDQVLVFQSCATAFTFIECYEVNQITSCIKY